MVWNNFRTTGSKYGSRKVSYKGMEFDSKYEYERWLYLEHQQKMGEISGLRRQTPFTLITKTTRMVARQLKTKVRYDERVVEMAALYHNDFTYRLKDGTYVSEEFKSSMTAKLADYVLRRKLMVKKIYEHNQKGRGQWIFREVVYSGRKLDINDR